jgi:hypothetical protein
MREKSASDSQPPSSSVHSASWTDVHETLDDRYERLARDDLVLLNDDGDFASSFRDHDMIDTSVEAQHHERLSCFGRENVRNQPFVAKKP